MILTVQSVNDCSVRCFLCRYKAPQYSPPSLCLFSEIYAISAPSPMLYCNQDLHINSTISHLRSVLRSFFVYFLFINNLWLSFV